MDPKIELHLGKYQRYLWKEAGLLLVHGQFAEVLVSRDLYESRHAISQNKETSGVQLDRFMACAALAAVSLADRESWGWTITTENCDYGWFCGLEAEGMICGRVGPAQAHKVAGYVQRQKAKGPLTQSHFTPIGTDPARLVEQYFDIAIQTQTRLSVGPDGSGYLVQQLPDGDFDRLGSLDDTQMAKACEDLIASGVLMPMHEVVIFYECRCDDQMILDMILSLPDEQRAEIWGEEQQLEIECPRCGRNYVLARATNPVKA